MCKYCDFKDGYTGDSFSFTKHIDGKKQNVEVYIFDSPEDEQHVLQIDSDYMDIRSEIKYCPMRGKKL